MSLRLFRWRLTLLLGILVALSLVFRLPATVHADSPTGLSSLTPTLNGPLVRTSLFQHDIENATRHYTNSTTSTAWDSINYIRLTEYAWAVDPFEDGDSTRDYYIVFVSATVQAGGTDQNGHPWCLYNRADYGSENLKIRTQLGTILGDKVSPVNTVHGDAIATIGFNLGLALGGGQGTTGSVSAGISWSQTIFDWTTEVVSLNSTEVSWRTTISHGFFPGVEDCNTDAWVWGYAAAISVGQGQTPVIDVSFTGTFYIPGSLCNNNIWVTILSPIGSLLLGCLILPSLSQAHPIERPPISTGAVNLSIPSRLKVLFETNPLVGSIAFRSTSESAFGSGVEFGHDEYSGFTPGTYYATAIPPEDYVFDHWEANYGITLSVPQTTSNPIVVNVQVGTYSIGILKAIFAAKLTFLTDPPDVGSIGYSPDNFRSCSDLQPHHNGDWVYVSALPPDSQGSANAGQGEYVCANTPAGYTFDHWTSTARFVPGQSTDRPVIALSGPSKIKAWFTAIAPPPPSISAPDAPNTLIATGQYERADLTWNPPAFDGGSRVTGYQIYRGTSPNSLLPLATLGNQHWYQDFTVTNGQSYYYEVSALNSIGEGSRSNVDSAKPGVDSISVSPDSRSVLTGGQIQFSAVAQAESGDVIPGISFSWYTTVPRANITSTGLFTAGTITGTFTEEVSASTGGVTRFATVIVQSTTPGRNPSASLSFLDSLSSFDSLVGIASGALIASVVGAFFYSRKGKGQVGKRN